MRTGMTFGALLEQWRRERGLSRQQLAAAVGTSTSAVRTWETGRRRPARPLHQAIDDALEAGGAFLDLTFALDTPEASSARTLWRHNYRAAAPIWAWIRSVPGQAVTYRIGWGNWGFEQQSGPEGVIVTSRVAVENPPATVEIEPAGWVDFGAGPIPPWFPVPQIEGTDHAGPTVFENRTLRVVAGRLQSLLDHSQREASELAEFLRVPAARLETVINQHPRSATGTGPTIPLDEFGTDRLRQLRTARHLSQREVVMAAAELPGSETLPPLTLHHVRAAEAGTTPRVPFLLGRLDLVYRCDGRLGLQEVGSSSGTLHELHFPAFWVGPVWLELSAPTDRRARAVVRWGDWGREIEAVDTTRFTTRKAASGTDPMLVQTATDCEIRFGIGEPNQAVDINDNWVPVSEAAKHSLIEATLNELITLAGRTRAELDGFLAPDVVLD